MKLSKVGGWIKEHPVWSVLIVMIVSWRVGGYYPLFYSGDSISGRVVDLTIGKPVVGAVAVYQFRS